MRSIPRFTCQSHFYSDTFAAGLGWEPSVPPRGSLGGEPPKVSTKSLILDTTKNRNQNYFSYMVVQISNMTTCQKYLARGHVSWLITGIKVDTLGRLILLTPLRVTRVTKPWTLKSPLLKRIPSPPFRRSMSHSMRPYTKRCTPPQRSSIPLASCASRVLSLRRMRLWKRSP